VYERPDDDWIYASKADCDDSWLKCYSQPSSAYVCVQGKCRMRNPPYMPGSLAPADKPAIEELSPEMWYMLTATLSMQPNTKLQAHFEKKKLENNYKHPIISVHIREPGYANYRTFRI